MIQCLRYFKDDKMDSMLYFGKHVLRFGDGFYAVPFASLSV